MLVSIIIPSYNEKDTLSEIVDLVNNQKDIEKEIIVIDDYSTDGTRELIKKEIFNKVSKVIYHDKNLGKGAALRSGLNASNGDIIIMNADLSIAIDYSVLLKLSLMEELMLYTDLDFREELIGYYFIGIQWEINSLQHYRTC